LGSEDFDKHNFNDCRMYTYLSKMCMGEMIIVYLHKLSMYEAYTVISEKCN